MFMSDSNEQLPSLSYKANVAFGRDADMPKWWSNLLWRD